MGKEIDGRTGKNEGVPSKKVPEVGSKTRQDDKKVDFAGQKTSAIPRKIARNRVRNGEKWEKRRFLERKRRGEVEAKKWDLLQILQCYEVTKWVQMKFSRIFFRRSLAGNAEMPYLCTRNREATLLQERVTL